jgi:hypothetical protein
MPQITKQRLTTLVLFGAALMASLRLYCLINPFYIPTVDDSAIVMRYLVNFQHGHFFTYNVEDGPVYGISCFWLGVTAGALSWAGLAPQAALMTVALASTILFFYAALRLSHFATNNVYASVLLCASAFYAALFIPRTMFLGLETPLHLWLVCELLLSYVKKQTRLFYLLSVICIISKLDAVFIVSCLGLMKLYTSYTAGTLAREVKHVGLFFVAPLLVWLIAATILFGNPIPQSFQSKFLLIGRVPSKNWFPFLEPLINSPKNLHSVLLALGGMVLAIGLRLDNRVSGNTSSMFAYLCLGTMSLYYVYNPGERMAWYYALPEFLALMSLSSLPADVYRSQRLRPPAKVLVFGISISLLFFTVRIRAPMHVNAGKAAPAWQIIYEKERLESGLLANQIAPKERPTLWTGHGYPAYLFKGYVVDYAGLNFRHIWDAVKEARKPSLASAAFLRDLGLNDAEINSSGRIDYNSGLLLMKMYNPNVYMQHGLFTASIQRARHLRLAGSFYNMSMVGSPALRVFVEDATWKQVTVSADFSETGKRQLIHVPKGASEVMFGVEQGRSPKTVAIHAASGQTFSCVVPPFTNELDTPEVHPCKISGLVSLTATEVDIRDTQGSPLKLYEPTATLPIAD